MQLGLTDDELDAVAREVHGMWHRGATEAEGLERLKTRLSRGQYDKLPWLLRPFFDRVIKRHLGSMWGAEHCGPDHDVVICDEPSDV